MKKIAYKKSLQLNKEVVRALTSVDLRDVDGGIKPMTRSICAGDCQQNTGHACQI